MKLDTEFKKALESDYDIASKTIGKINSIICQILMENNIKITEEEYFDLLEECCMGYMSSLEMRNTSKVEIPSMVEVIANTIIIHSNENNWDNTIEISSNKKR